MTYGEKLLQWRGEIQVMVGELLDSDDPEQALLLVQAITTIKQAHVELGKLGLVECDWAPKEPPK